MTPDRKTFPQKARQIAKEHPLGTTAISLAILSLPGVIHAFADGSYIPPVGSLHAIWEGSSFGADFLALNLIGADRLGVNRTENGLLNRRGRTPKAPFPPRG